MSDKLTLAKKALKLVRHPRKIIPALGYRGYLDFIPDKQYLSLLYWAAFGKRMDWETPRTFNEKLQWLKLYDRNPLYTKLVDKYEVRSYVAEKIGEEYLVPLIGVYDSFDEIDFSNLPEQFVLKTTHDSGGVVICKDRHYFSIDSSRKKIITSLSRNYYYSGREWPYKNVKPRIVCDSYLVDESGKELKDYKVYCFKGEPHVVQVDYSRFTDHKRNFYDTEWNFLNISLIYSNSQSFIIEKPKNLDLLLKLCKQLSSTMPFVRVDFYTVYDKLYFGEITFYPESGFGKFNPESHDSELGALICLI